MDESFFLLLRLTTCFAPSAAVVIIIPMHCGSIPGKAFRIASTSRGRFGNSASVFYYARATVAQVFIGVEGRWREFAGVDVHAVGFHSLLAAGHPVQMVRSVLVVPWMPGVVHVRWNDAVVVCGLLLVVDGAGEIDLGGGRGDDGDDDEAEEGGKGG